jgi:hypothetical protein
MNSERADKGPLSHDRDFRFFCKWRFRARRKPEFGARGWGLEIKARTRNEKGFLAAEDGEHTERFPRPSRERARVRGRLTNHEPPITNHCFEPLRTQDKKGSRNRIDIRYGRHTVVVHDVHWGGRPRRRLGSSGQGLSYLAVFDFRLTHYPSRHRVVLISIAC